MSYILDALKKSEQARQQNAPLSHYSLWPVIDEEAGQRRWWPYGIAALLLANAALVGYWLRPTLATEPRVAAMPVAAAPAAPAVKEQTASVAATQPAAGESAPPAIAAVSATSESVKSVEVAAHVAPPAATAVPPAMHPASDAASAGGDHAAPSKEVVAIAAVSRNAVAPVSRSQAPAKPMLAAARTAEPVSQAKAKPVEAAKAAESPDRPSKKTEANEAVKVAIAATSAPAAADRGGKPASVEASPAPAKANDQGKESANREELPVALQKELPALAVSGFIHDGDAEGMVIVNDRLLRAGDEVAPGLKLEKIMKDNLVFTYKGYRFTR